MSEKLSDWLNSRRTDIGSAKVEYAQKTTRIQYVCPKCGHTFSKTFQKDSPIPEELIFKNNEAHPGETVSAYQGSRYYPK